MSTRRPSPSVVGGTVVLHGTPLPTKAGQVCFPKPLTPSPNNLPGADISLHQMFFIVGSVCLGVSVIACLLNFGTHLVWRSNFKEQRQLMRITILPAIFAVFSWCSVARYGAGTYMDPVPKLYDMYCVICFFNYMIQVIAPDEATRHEFFIGAARLNRRNKKLVHRKGSLRMFRYQFVVMYVSLFIVFLMTLATEFINIGLCHSSKANQIFSIAIQVVTFVFTASAIMTLLRFYRRYQAEFQGTHLLRRLVTFKVFLLIIIHQQLIFEIITFTRIVTPTQNMSMADWLWGIQEFMLCAEALIASFFYMTTLSGWRYRNRKVSSGPGASKRSSDESFWKYLACIILPWDILMNFAHALRTIPALIRGKNSFDYTGGTGISWEERQGKSNQAMTAAPENRVYNGVSDSDESDKSTSWV